MAKRPTMIAVFDGYGDVSQVRVEEAPRPQPGPGQVLLQVVAAGVSHMDAYVREGRFQDAIELALPARQGVSLAGIVRAVGEGVRELRVGDEVFGHDPAHGAHATHVVVDAAAVVRKPRRLSWEVAGCLYLTGLTAYELVQSVRLGAEDVVVVTAAAGGVGHIECQLARLAGARVVGIAGRENHDYLRSIGVKPVAYGDDVEKAVREAADSRPVTALFDNYGRYEALAEALEVTGDRFVRTERRRDAEIELWTAGADPRLAVRLRDVAELVAEWNVRILVSGFYPFQALDRALVDLDARHSRGVVVVGMDTTAPPSEYLRGTLRAHHERAAAAG
ncbi:NADP-dependent oxidoreductase [Amnibacterium endophyticum]|uniref:NADP-dependent oxidoreductase n=1 Tax=Amnibacterium endophyticum TaxID=2109337 RepID=A0ABW4LEK0_9MICO